MSRFLAIFLAAVLSVGGAVAQTVVSQPVFVPSKQWIDLGNGPLDIQPIEGNGDLYSSFGSGQGSTSGSTTSLVLTTTPLVSPCIGCVISGPGITSGTTVSAFTLGTSIALSTSMSVTPVSLVSWGAACPAATAANVPGVFPNGVASLSPPAPARSSIGGTYPFYTQARVCAYGAAQNGFTLLYFAIGAH